MEILEFNEEQKAAMAKALMSVAEEVANEPKEPKANEPLRSGEIIELLSDSEDDSCEILGFITLDTGDTISEVVPINVKAEIKEENIALNGDMGGTYRFSVQDVTAAVETQSDSQAPVDLDDIPPYKCARLVTKVEAIGSNIGIWYPPAEETPKTVPPASSPVCSSEPVSSGSIKPTANTFTTFLDLTQDIEEEIDVKVTGEEESTDGTDTASEKEVDSEQPSQLVTKAEEAPTIGADQFDDDDDCHDEDTFDNDDDIIELGDSSEDEDMDEETEKKLVSLIESDSEDSNQMPAEANTTPETKSNTTAMLIHLSCPVCGVSCGSDKKWKAHVDSEHNFHSIENLQVRTIIAREGELRYQCKECTRKFNFSTAFSKMMEHRITHLPLPNYMKCRLCDDERFSTRYKIRTHLKNKHRKIFRGITSPTMKMRHHILFHCPICYESVKNRYRWRTHLEEQHNYFNELTAKLTLDPSGQTSCPDCDKNFGNKRIQLHLLSHEKYKSFKCKLCDTFETHSLATCLSHIRIQHFQGGKRIYKCRYCDAKFERITDRNDHLQEKHKMQKQKCEVCEKTFTSTPYLLSHMNTNNHQKLK